MNSRHITHCRSDNVPGVHNTAILYPKYFYVLLQRSGYLSVFYHISLFIFNPPPPSSLYFRSLREALTAFRAWGKYGEKLIKFSLFFRSISARFLYSLPQFRNLPA